MLNLTLLGSGGTMPTPERFLSSLIIDYKGRKILMDCGEGTQVAMRKFNTGFRTLDIICITHLHGDHIYGLPGLLATIGNSNRTEPLTIIGPMHIKKLIEEIILPITYAPFGIYVVESPNEDLGLSIIEEGLRIVEESNSTEMTLSTIELDHSAPCLGYSFYLKRHPKFIVEKAMGNGVPREIWKALQHGESFELNGRLYKPEMVLGDKRKGIKLSYITDSRSIDNIVPFIKDSDLLICEGTYGDDEDIQKAKAHMHMTFGEAANLARKGKVRDLLLTHFSQTMDDPREYKDNATKIFHNTAIGYDGWKKTLKYR
ncbi:ribonuclease Z [Tissierella creatinini]|nr:ribonuclease Z [Tissierella creatinini]TJX66518.1 ribonuclease Z [Soehngenia saccharolytica]